MKHIIQKIAIGCAYLLAFSCIGPLTTRAQLTVNATSPANSATAVSVSTGVTATFSEAVDPTTVSRSTFELLDSSGAVVPAILTYDSNTFTATLTPSSALAYSASYTATLKGGGSGIKDLAGNPLTVDYTWSFVTVADPPPEPAGWYAGDMHVHRSCGGSPVDISTIYNAMVAQNVSLVSLLADMGNGEVQNPVTDLPKVNGQDDPISTSSQIIHWDAEWHWDATYSQYAHQALGGHLVNLGLTEAQQIWQEYTYPITNWAHQQGGISGFCHMQYLGEDFPTSLTCCTPIEYPVEVALGTADFIAEDVDGGDTAIDAYYRLLNCGFRPGLAAGSDYPCGQVIGPMLTYGQVAGGQLSYQGWIDAIARGRTVVSRVGHTQFLNLQVNGTATPGDEIKLASPGDVTVSVQWTTTQSLERTIELVCDGDVVDSQDAQAGPGVPYTLTTTVTFTNSGWLCARVMGAIGHEVHTAAVFVTVNGAPVRASVDDANFYVQWMDNLLTNTSPGGVWNSYFPTSLAAAQARYQAAKTVYQQIAAGLDVAPTVITPLPTNAASTVPIGSSVTATFSEALDASTVSGSTFILTDASGDSVAASVTYDAGRRRATLTPSGPLAYLTTYTATLKGGSSGIKDPAGTVLAADSVWSFSTAALTLPTVSSTSPASDASGVVPSTTVSATFNEALNPSTVNASTFQLNDASGSLVPATVAYNNSSYTATLSPSAPLTAGSYTATLRSGANGITDVTGNELAADYVWSFAVANYNCPCRIFQPTDAPQIVNLNDNQPVELGMRFQSSVDGYITGVRFYKGSSDSGTHVGHLWSSTGTMLAEVNFNGETASGWQEADFTSPVAITAGTTFIVSYHSSGGYYCVTDDYFTQPIVNGPLQGLADGEDGPNGLYIYSASSAFPTYTYQSDNYWVDVVFATTVGPDVTPPTVVSTSPVAGATAVAVGSSVTATFSEAIASSTVSGTTFELRDSANALVPATISYNASTFTATLTPSAALAYNSIYTVTLMGGATDPRITDMAGNALAVDDVWPFTTAGPPPPPPDQGAGGPILVVSDVTYAANPFGTYYAEILNAQGFNAYSTADISTVTAATLTNYDVVLLGEMPLTSDQITMFDAWVANGGTLIAFRPVKPMAALYGLSDASGTTSEGYLAINTNTPIGRGVVGDTIQFHGTADDYTLSGASSLATLYSDATTPTAYPAVVTYNRGSGHVVIFTFDLARSIAYMRQGNPAWAGQEGDGAAGIRATDMFVHPGQTNWIDTSKMLIPQADEQMHLLTHAIEQFNATKRPLPRLWYFPNLLKGVLIMTGDSEGCADNLVNVPMQDVDSYGGSYTVYLLGTGPYTVQDVNGWLAKGNGVAVHYDDTAEATSPTINGMTGVYDAMTQAFTNAYGFGPRTVRNHWIVWVGWAEQAQIEANHGIQLDANYYHWGSWLGSTPGYFTGSGLPMRFADGNGGIIDVYQANTQLPDETWTTGIYTAFKTLIDRSLDQGYYAFLTANFHPPYYGTYQPEADQMMAYANSRGVPIWSAEMLLNFLQARNQARIDNIAWDGTHLTFGFTRPAYTGLTLMIPAQAGGNSLQTIDSGGNSVAFTVQTIKGYDYALFQPNTGTYQATYAPDTTPPVISAVTATAGVGGVATITWTTDEQSDSLVSYGTDPNSLTLTNYDPTLVTSHSISLTGLSSATTYYFRVTSTDAAGNSATSPDSPAPPSSFNTPSAAFVDTTVADFSAGTLDTNTYISQTYDGEVILNPTVGAEFSGSTLPAGWSATIWPGGSGSATVANGSLTLDGAAAETTASYGPGRSLEFVATIGAEANQHVGFVSDLAFDSPWAIFSTKTSTSTLYARTALAGISSPIDTQISSSYIGSSHRYRIDWTTSNVLFSVDGTPVATNSTVISSAMLPAASDLNVGSPNLSIDWMRMSPYAASGTFVSRVFDAGAAVNWSALSWTGETPAGTTLGLSYRMGNTQTPDGSWTAFIPVSVSGGALTGNSRYVQYQAQLATADATQTPVLDDVTIFYSSGPDTTPPVISAVAATAGNGGTTATITWTTDEPANSQVDYGTDSNSLILAASDASLVTSHSVTLIGLTPATTYYFRVTATDAANNSATSPASPAAPASFFTIDTTAPVISTVTATVGPGSTATITWTTDESSDSQVNYGTDSNSLTLAASDASLVTSHSITLPGLASATTYYFRVTSTDAYGNGATSPASPALPASFVSARTKPPVISAVTASAGSGGTATVTWTTDESSDSQISYGTSSNSLTLTASSAAQVTSHSLSLSGLSSATTYYFRVSSTDAYGNGATSPASPAPPASFTTLSATFVDTTVADFSAGTTNNTYISQTTDGEVILNPTVGAEFYGSALPTGWSSTIWASGGSAIVAGGSLTLDGAGAETTGSYGPVRSLEFVATFNAAANQHIGFVSDLAFDSPWAIFSTKTGTNIIYARTALSGNNDVASTQVGSNNLIGSSHRYRIDWTTSNVVFSIDGTPVATNATVISSSMAPAASDLAVGGPNLSIDWMRMTPYAAAGTFMSRVFDGGSAANWSALSWDSQTPPGTTLAMSYRIGNTPSPDASWTTFIPVTVSGSTLAGNARYFQYSAQLATPNPNQTPELDDVTIGYNLNPETASPTIISVSPVPGATGVSTNTTVTVSFSEPMNTATITATSFRLRLLGGSTDLAATVSSPGATATLTPNSPLLPGRYYQATVAGTVTDSNGNPLGSDTVWTFLTAPVTASQTDTTMADFNAGTPGACLVISQLGNGEVILAPTLNQDFSGTTLPAGWTSSTWASGGTVTVAGGIMAIDGAMAQTATAYGPGRSLEFVATFGAATSQHVGFATDSSFSSYAMFSTASSTTILYARASGKSDIAISGSWLGSPHHYLITWTASNVVYWIDGVLVASQAVAISANMRPMGSDFSVGGPKLSVDWMRMSPYTTPCTFTSRVIDAGQAVTWYTLSWTALTPTGTTLAMSYHTGNTPTPDGTWTAFAPVSASGGALAGSSRYFQYAAQLATSDTNQTPVLEDVTVTYVLYVPPGPSSTTLTSSANPALPGTAVTFTATVTGAGTPTGTVQFKNNGTLFDTETLSSGSASSVPISTLPHGNDAITAEYSGDANFLASTGSLTQTIDTPPAAGMQYLTTVMNTPLNVSASTLAGLNFDADGDPLTITAVSATSTNGFTVSLNGTGNTNITYAPTGNYVGADQFTYTISDGYPGGTATSTAKVTVRLGNATSVFSSVSGSSGTVSLRGYGIPGNQYDIQISSDMVNWSYLTTVTAGPSGVILCTDTTAGTGTRFYRFAVH